MIVATSARALTALVLTAGVVCQFVQHTDPVYPLLYFTVDSAALAVAVAVYGLVSPTESKGMARVRGAAAVGVILSGLMYAAVIAPASPTGTWFQPGDDTWVRTATVLMHGIGPFLVIADFLTHRYTPGHGWSEAARWCLWPIAYLAALLPVHVAWNKPIPYAFLQPQKMGGLAVVVAVSIGIAAVFTLLGRTLLLAQEKIPSIARSATSSHVKPTR